MRLKALCFALCALSTAQAAPLTIASSSNFRAAVEEIATYFTADTGHAARVTTASTGKLYTQITLGAPFDILLAADSKHPQLLETSGHGVPGSRFTYAIGGLVLWSQSEKFAHVDCRAQLEDIGSARLAIANPVSAPYGVAAHEFLRRSGLLSRVDSRLVFGENIAQALHFVVTGNAELGLIARSQALDTRLPAATCSWAVPSELHEPIEQQAILLRRAAGNAIAMAFLDYLRGATARDIVMRHGYATPE